MKQEMTNEEVARVFAMYLPCEVQCGMQSGWTLSRKKYPADLRFYVENKNRIKGLLLKPLSAISEDHWVELSMIMGVMPHSIVDFIEQMGQCIAQDEMPFDAHDINWNMLTIYYVVQYLISKSYAVPLFFGVNHPNNGMTAIELGIALDASQLKN